MKDTIEQEIERNFQRKIRYIDEQTTILFSKLAGYGERKNLNEAEFIIQKGEELKAFRIDSQEAYKIRAVQLAVLRGETD
jgi:hypothetical protein